MVSVVHITKGKSRGSFDLDGRDVPIITAYLFHSGSHDDPVRLSSNNGKSYIGTIALGMGFTFDDTDSTGAANKLTEMHRLISANPKNSKCVFPYIGGEELNDSPTHTPYRYIINFRDWPLRREDLDETWAEANERTREGWLRSGIVPLDYPDVVAADYPELLDIVRQKVKPYRDQLKRDVYRNRWWQFGEKQMALYDAIKDLDRVLVISRVGQ